MSDFLGGSILSWILLFLISFSIILLPSIILGYMARYKQSLYVIAVWIVIAVTINALVIFVLNTAGKGSLVSNLHDISEFSSYIPLYAAGLLVGSYVGRNNEKWKLDKKMPVYLTILSISILNFLWFIIIVVSGGIFH